MVRILAILFINKSTLVDTYSEVKEMHIVNRHINLYFRVAEPRRQNRKSKQTGSIFSGEQQQPIYSEKLQEKA